MLEPGKTLGGFRIVRALGQGAMATVYEATQARLRRRVALKVLHPGFAGEPRAVQRFLREAEAAGSLHHPSIVIVHDRGQDGDLPFIVMEIVEGPTLAEVIRHAAGRSEAGVDLPPELPQPDTPAAERLEFVVEVGIATAEALHHAHERGVVHRDVKPSNILLQDGRPKVSDFGLAAVMWGSQLTATGERLGTPAYMSPEQALGRETDRRSDVYSLGATLYELATLRLPIECETIQDYFHRIPEEDPAPARTIEPAVPRDLDVILAKAMHKEPGRRYATADEMARDLTRFRMGDAIRARPDGPVRKAVRAVRRRPWLRFTLLALLIALAAALVLVKAWPSDDAYLTLRGPAGAPVKLIPLERDGTLRWGHEIPMGTLPLENERVPPGEYRAVVGGRDAFAEILINLEEKERKPPIDVKLTPTRDVIQGMVRIRAGTYSVPDLGRPVTVRAFWIDVHEVTIAEFHEFLVETNHPPPRLTEAGKYIEEAARMAAPNMTWYHADAYAAWVGKRLPTMEEWLVAFGFPDGRHGPTDGNVDSEQVKRVDDLGPDRTFLGLIGMFGNVCEWTASWQLPLDGPEGERGPRVLRVKTGHCYGLERDRGLVGAMKPAHQWATGARCVKSDEP